MKHVPIIKVFTLVLVFCIADTYLLAAARKADISDKNAATNIAPSKLLLGRLYVPYHQEILVDGHSARSGDTIVSGSRLQTNFFRATVAIMSAGELQIEPETDLLLTFDERSVRVTVAVGNVTLSTSDGVKGEVIMPDGEVCPSTAQAQGQQPPEPRPPSIPAIPVHWYDPEILGIVGVDIGTWIGVSEEDDPCRFEFFLETTASGIRGGCRIPF